MIKRILIAIAVLAILAAIAAYTFFSSFRSGANAWKEPLGDIDLVTQAIPLNTADPDQTHIGPLEYLGGFKLTSPHIRFGGLSGLHISADGSELLAVTDQGLWMHALPIYDNGRLVGLEQGYFDQMRRKPGRLLGWEFGDAESLFVTPDMTAYIGLEDKHRIITFGPREGHGLKTMLDDKTGPATTIWLPDQDALPRNGGVEAMTMLPDGSLLLLTEELENPDGTLVGWILTGEDFAPLSFQPKDGFSPVAMDRLPSGDLLVLERRYTPILGVASRLCIVKGADVMPGASLHCKQIAELKSPYSVDNLEGMAIRPDGPHSDSVIVYLLSDDNFNNTQDTLLMMFRLELG